MEPSVYALLQESDYPDEFKNILNEEYADYQKNKKVITKTEMDNLVKEAMNYKRNPKRKFTNND